MQEKRNCRSRFTRRITRVIFSGVVRGKKNRDYATFCMEGTVAFPACIPYVRPGYCLTPGSTCRATRSGAASRTRYYSSRNAARALTTRGTLTYLKIAIRERARFWCRGALHSFPPEYDGPWWHARTVKGAREISTYTAWYGTFRPFSRYLRDMTLRPNQRRCNSSNVAN